MSSRYDRNAKLYEDVKNNNYEEHNSKIVDDNFDFDNKGARSDFQEKKRLSVYFKDIEDELATANTKLDDLNHSEGMEIRRDIDLASLIEQAKKKNVEQGGQIFSNTQHEILNSLDVLEAEEGPISDTQKNLILEDILGETKVINLNESVQYEEDPVSIVSIDDIFVTENINPSIAEPVNNIVEEEVVNVEEVSNNNLKVEDSNNSKNKYNDSFELVVEEPVLFEENRNAETSSGVESKEVEPKEVEPKEVEPKEVVPIKKKNSNEKIRSSKTKTKKEVDKKAVKEKNKTSDNIVTVILIVLIVVLVTLGFIYVKNYI